MIGDCLERRRFSWYFTAVFAATCQFQGPQNNAFCSWLFFLKLNKPVTMLVLSHKSSTISTPNANCSRSLVLTYSYWFSKRVLYVPCGMRLWQVLETWRKYHRWVNNDNNSYYYSYGIISTHIYYVSHHVVRSHLIYHQTRVL